MDSGLFNAHLAELEAASDISALVACFDDIIGHYGGIGFVAAAWSVEDASRILLYTSLKDPFAQLDAESAWWADDPIVARLIAGAVKPFRYEDAWTNPLPTAASRWDAMVQAGLERGIVFPTSRPPYIGSLLVFGALPSDGVDRLSEQQSMLHLLATYFHGLIVDFAPEEGQPSIIRNSLTVDHAKRRQFKLSEREIGCLRWLALGKSASDIAVIEGLSVHTVRFYLREAMQKLGASTQAQAVAMAIKYALIKA